MQYEVYEIRRGLYAVYDNFANEPVCRRNLKPYTAKDSLKVARLAGRLNSARETADVAVALIDFGATASDAWRYAQTKFALSQEAAANAEP